MQSITNDHFFSLMRLCFLSCMTSFSLSSSISVDKGKAKRQRLFFFRSITRKRLDMGDESVVDARIAIIPMSRCIADIVT